jgi:RhoGAP domain/RasGEF domain/SH3 domain/Ankyrin repeats (3 copies)/Ankyrin repeat
MRKAATLGGTRRGRSKRKDKKNAKVGHIKIFGQPLSAVAKFDSGAQMYTLPEVVLECLNVLFERGTSVQGIFRISALHDEVEACKDIFESGQLPGDDMMSAHTAASLLKTFLRELPEPLFPFRFYEPMLTVARNLDDEELQLRYFCAMISLLPAPNRQLFLGLLPVVASVARNQHVTMMGAQNLATVFGPTLLRSDTTDLMNIMSDSGVVNQVFEFLFERCEDVADQATQNVECGTFVACARIVESASNVAVAVTDTLSVAVSGADLCFVVSDDGTATWRIETLEGIQGTVSADVLDVVVRAGDSDVPAAAVDGEPASASVESALASTSADSMAASTTPALSADAQAAAAAQEGLLQALVWCCNEFSQARLEALAPLLRESTIDEPLDTRSGDTALHVAARRGCVPVCEALLKKNAAVDAVNLTEETPLHLLVAFDRFDLRQPLGDVGALMARLCDYGATARRTLTGDTPLHYAARSNAPAVVGTLLAAGADPASRNLAQETPFMVALRRGVSPHVARLLVPDALRARHFPNAAALTASADSNPVTALGAYIRDELAAASDASLASLAGAASLPRGAAMAHLMSLLDGGGGDDDQSLVDMLALLPAVLEQPTASSSDSADSIAQDAASMRVAAYDYDASRPDMISFRKGDMIKLLCVRSKEWAEGSTDAMARGIFPLPYCRELTDAESAAFIEAERAKAARAADQCLDWMHAVASRTGASAMARAVLSRWLDDGSYRFDAAGRDSYVALLAQAPCADAALVERLRAAAALATSADPASARHAGEPRSLAIFEQREKVAESVLPGRGLQRRAVKGLSASNTSPTSVASYLSLWARGLVSRVKCRELVALASSAAASPHACASTSAGDEAAVRVLGHCADVAAWSAARVLSAPADRRADAVARFIGVVDVCLSTFDDYLTAFAVLEGLTHPAVVQLSESEAANSACAGAGGASLKRTLAEQSECYAKLKVEHRAKLMGGGGSASLFSLSTVLEELTAVAHGEPDSIDSGKRVLNCAKLTRWRATASAALSNMALGADELTRRERALQFDAHLASALAAQVMSARIKFSSAKLFELAVKSTTQVLRQQSMMRRQSSMNLTSRVLIAPELCNALKLSSNVKVLVITIGQSVVALEEQLREQIVHDARALRTSAAQVTRSYRLFVESSGGAPSSKKSGGGGGGGGDVPQLLINRPDPIELALAESSTLHFMTTELSKKQQKALEKESEKEAKIEKREEKLREKERKAREKKASSQAKRKGGGGAASSSSGGGDDDDDMMFGGGGQFGLPLAACCSPVVSADGNDVSWALPAVATCTLDYLDEHAPLTEGVFRVSAPTSALEATKAAFEAGGTPPDLDNVHVAAGLLKLFLRELPDPLVPFNFYDIVLAIQRDVADEGRRANYLRSMVALLPGPERTLLARIVRLAASTSTNEFRTKMSPSNLAVVFGPTVCRSASDDPMAIVTDGPTIQDAFTYIFEHASDIFDVPPARAPLGFVALSSTPPDNVGLAIGAEQNQLIVERLAQPANAAKLRLGADSVDWAAADISRVMAALEESESAPTAALKPPDPATLPPPSVTPAVVMTPAPDSFRPPPRPARHAATISRSGGASAAAASSSAFAHVASVRSMPPPLAISSSSSSSLPVRPDRRPHTARPSSLISPPSFITPPIQPPIHLPPPPRPLSAAATISSRRSASPLVPPPPPLTPPSPLSAVHLPPPIVTRASNLPPPPVIRK